MRIYVFCNTTNNLYKLLFHISFKCCSIAAFCKISQENGNADTTPGIAAAATTPNDQFTSNDTTTTTITTVTTTTHQQQKFNSGISADTVFDNSATAAAAEETRTNEDLDTEVSQINTQSKSQNESVESFSRPMSRTSSMTPVNNLLTSFIQFYKPTFVVTSSG